MSKTFSAEDIDAIMLDIECLSLPDEFKYPVLRLVLGAVEDYSSIRPEFNELVPIENMPDFLKHQKRRYGDGPALTPEKIAAVRDTLVTSKEFFDGEAALDPEALTLQPRTSVAPQAAFSPAPVPEAVRADPQATAVPAPAEDPAPAPTLEGVELKSGPWSQEDKDHLLAQRANGVPYKDIALQLCRPLAATNAKHSNLMKAMEDKLTPAKNPAPKKPKPTTPDYETGPWTSESEQYLINQRAKGVAFKVIALQLNRPERGVFQKYYNLRDAEQLTPAPALKPVRKTIPAAPALASKAEGGAGVLPHPCPDESWSIEDDLALVSEHHRGLSMLDVSIVLERTKPVCVKRYNSLMDAMPAGPFTERQIKLKQTLAHHAQLASKAA